MNYLNNLTWDLFWHLPTSAIVVAQQITDPNIVGQMQKAWNHFIQTGQVWALLIGLVIGYMIKGLTTFG